MERIEYRGLKTDSTDWVYGDILTNNGEPIIVQQAKRDYIQHSDAVSGCYWSIDVPAFKVKPGTLGKSTDFNDKKGKAIFVGDIVKIRWVEETFTTHTGDNIIHGSFTEHDGYKILEASYTIINKDGCFSLDTSEQEPPAHYYEPFNPLGFFIDIWYEHLFTNIDDNYFEDEGFETLNELKESLGVEVIGNIHENPELLS